jgi:isopenicillin-N epimerase
MRQHWTLDPQIVFLNHGSFGACPIPVLEAQSRWRAQLEREPVQFFTRVLDRELDAARSVAATFVGARFEDFVFVRNSTAGANAVLRSLAFGPGDALLTTDHAYHACRNTLDYVARRSGAQLVVANIPLPLTDPDEVTARILEAVTPRVRLALVDHVSSHTGLVFPIASIVAALRERGIETLVDGAHAPGMLPLDVERIGAGYYVGNFHKWVCAPKGAAMLCVRRDLQPDIHPTVISHGLTSERARGRFLEEFDWTGSDDPSPWLCVPDAIAFLDSVLPGGFAEVRTRNRALVLQARTLLGQALGVQFPAPESMIGSLCALPLPEVPREVSEADGAALSLALYERHRIEVPVFVRAAAPRRMLRVSAQLYNTLGDYQLLAEALRVELEPHCTSKNAG